MTDDEKLIEKFEIKEISKWRSEEEKELKTLQGSILKISRIVFDGEDPPKRCIAFSKNRKSVAFDIEMVPVIIAVMKKITPKAFIPEDLRDSY